MHENRQPTDIRQLPSRLADAAHPLLNLTGLRGSAQALAITGCVDTGGRPVLCVTASEREARLLEQDCSLFTDTRIIHYPGYDIPPYTPLSPDPETVAARISALYQAATANQPCILIASIEALLRRVLPKKILTHAVELVMRGEETDPHELTGRLTRLGYEPVSLVRTVGDFCLRGGILDIFTPGYSLPLRLDFFGDTLESLRIFDPISQRSVDELEEAEILPAGDILLPPENSEARESLVQRFVEAAGTNGWKAERSGQILEKLRTGRRFPGIEFFLPLIYAEAPPASPLDYLSRNFTIFVLDPPSIQNSLELTWERILANYQEAVTADTPALAPEYLFHTAADFDRRLACFRQIHVLDFVDSKTAVTLSVRAGNHKLLKQEIDLSRRREGLLMPLAARMEKWLTAGEGVAVACRSGRRAGHLAELLGHHGLRTRTTSNPLRLDQLERAAAEHSVLLYDQPLSEGFDVTAGPADGHWLHILSENELFGERRLGPRRRGRARSSESAGPATFDELVEGDIVVHKEHGLGLYAGLLTLQHRGITNDFLEIRYRDNDKLYVPVDNINSVSKYKGITEKQPRLDRLGGKTWLNTKKRVKEAVWQVAQDLLELYARRQMQKGRAFSSPSELFHELEESFPFEETRGQQKAIDEVLADLTSERTMDRLICGDVGYGKTEVAIRAAFKVVEDGFQVAVLVPTTVLAEQHTETFRERLDGFPVRAEGLSRFRSRTAQQKILKDLAGGGVDIIIGTHRLLSKDIRFKNLGLLIVDEEHRFGVSHKEKIKRLRAEVDVLTLTATPIPRTLQMSLLGIRDLSVIDTPPEHRRQTLTFVARYDRLVIKEAVVRELQRGGQVFLVHNRVRSIERMAGTVQQLVPEARLAIAHGQLPARNLEEIMVKFVNRQLDVLVCTTIIESGLDITNANTIVINRADRLGLAEIYQLRGRVGRSAEQAYAYLLVPSLDSLSRDARDRLRSVMDSSELGGGFKLAMSDLQIRGGGNILGISQSGHIAAVGYDLYLDLLQKTVSDLKRGASRDEAVVEVEPEINLQLSAFIPADYISDVNQRYIAYRKIAALATPEEKTDLEAELVDRYGPLPPETGNLFAIMALKVVMKELLVTRLEQGRDTLVFSFHEQTLVDPAVILRFVQEHREVRFTPDSRLVVALPPGAAASAGEILTRAGEVLTDLQQRKR